MTHGDDEAERRTDGALRREHAWSAGLTRLAEELEAFTSRLIDAQRSLSASQSPLPPTRSAAASAPVAARRSSRAGRPPPHRWSPASAPTLRERLDETESLVAHLEEERRRDAAARVVALGDAARRLEHAQQVIDDAQRRLATASDEQDPRSPPTAPPPKPPRPPPDAISQEWAVRAEQAVLRLEQFEGDMAGWEDELARQAELLERVARSCQDLEADLATRDEIELHIATLIERLSRSIARAPVG